MKILIVTDAWQPQVNGVVRTYEHMLPLLEKAGHTVEVIGPADFPWRRPMPGYQEIELTLFPYRRLAHRIKTFAPDSIHIATEGPLGLAARRYCRRNALPFSTAYHTQFPDYVAKRVARFVPAFYNPVRAVMIRWIRSFHAPAAAVMVATPSLQAQLTAWGFKTPLPLVSRGILTDLFTVDGPRAPENLPRPVALYVGRVAIEKNIEAFLEMNWHGSKIVVGDGPARPALQKTFPHVVFTGKKTGADLAAHFRGADVFVFPSRTDTFGMVLTEAMACGLPIAAYPVMGPQDIVTDEILGSLHEDLATAAAHALVSPGTRQDRHQHALKHYTWDVVTRQFLDMCQATAITR